MKNLKKKFLIKLIVLLCIITSLVCCSPNNRVYAGSSEDKVYGSVLITPITQLLTGLGDGAMDLIHKAVLEQDETIIRLDDNADSWWNQHGASVLGWLLGIGICVAIMALTLGGGGIAAVGLAGKAAGVSFVIKTVASALMWGTVAGTSVTAVATIVDATMLGDDLYLPVFNLTPEEIFSNEIWLFDVNFFEPEDEKNFTLQKDADKILVSKVDTKSGDSVKYGNVHTEAKKVETDKEGIITIAEAQTISGFKELIADVNTKLAENGLDEIEDSIHKLKVNYTNTYNTPAAGMEYLGAVEYEISRSETEIFIIYKEDSTNTTEYLSIICTSSTDNNNNVKETVTMQQLEKLITKKTSVATELKGVISEWYYNLRNLAVLILLLLLIYSGIRIVIGSSAGEKAKYKERCIDWVVSVCLIFMMHYIMVFGVELNDKFIEMVNTSNGIKGVEKIIHLNTTNHLNLATKDERLNDFIRDGGELGVTPGTKYLEWPTDIMGGFRIEQQKVNEGTANWIGYSICYLVLVVYTVIFTWTYLRRVLYMSFLTMIAPLVAMTYSLDKITDGKAQAFNSWIREYIFNLLIQPFHLILYTVLITSSYELAGDNALYAAVAIGFMTPAEKLLRKFFGFEKAQTPGALGGAAGAALAMGGLQKLISFGNKESNASQEQEENKEIKYSRADGVSAATTVAQNQLKDLQDEESSSSDGGGTVIRTQNGSGRNGVILETDDGSRSNNRVLRQDTITVSSSSSAADSTVDAGNVPAKIVANRTGDPTGTGLVTSARTDNAVGEGTRTSIVDSGNRKHVVLDSSSNAKKKNPKRLRTLRAVGTGIGAYTRALGRKNYKRIKKSRPIRSLIRGVAGMYGGAAMGLAGLVLGIASGDPSKAFQYTTTGAIGGWGVGKGLAGRARDTFAVDGNKLKQEMTLSYQGKDYKQHQLEKQKDELARDEESIMYLRKTLGVSRADAIKILKTTGADCLDNGIEDIEDIATQHQYKMDNVPSTLEDMANEDCQRALLKKIGDTYKEVDVDEEPIKQDVEHELEPEWKKITEEEEELEKEYQKIANGELYAARENKEGASEDAKQAQAEIAKIEEDKKQRIRTIDQEYDRKLKNAKDKAEKEKLEREQEQEKQAVYDEIDAQKDVVKQELKKKIKERLKDDTQSKLGQRKAQLEQKKKEFEEMKVQKIAAKKKQKQLEVKMKEESEKEWFKTLVKEKKREAEAALRDRNDRYEEALKKTFEQGVAFKKFSGRTPDFNKLGEDKIESYRKLFAKEMRDKMVEVLTGKGYSEQEAIRIAEERSGKAAQAIIDGVKKIDKVQSGLTEVSDE